MKVLLLVLTAIVCYVLGNLSMSAVLSRFVFRREAAKYNRAEAPILDFYGDFGSSGAVLLAVCEIAKDVLGVLIGGWLLGVVGLTTVGRLFAAFCLLLGETFPALYLFKGARGLLCAGVAAFLVDWRVGLCCWVAYIVVVIFTRYACIAAAAAALLGPIFLWIFGFTGLEGTLALLSALLVVIKYVPNIAGVAKGTEPRLNLGRPSPHGSYDDEDDF